MFNENLSASGRGYRVRLNAKSCGQVFDREYWGIGRADAVNRARKIVHSCGLAITSQMVTRLR